MAYTTNLAKSATKTGKNTIIPTYCRMKRPSLLECLTTPTGSSKWGDRISNPVGHLYFRDNNASVLAVGHLDYLMCAKPTKHNDIVRCPQLDDRLGVWVLLNLLPNMGVNVEGMLAEPEVS